MVLLDITERAKTVRTETLRMLRWFMCFSWTAQWPHGRFKEGARAKGSLQRKENLRRLRVMASSNLIGPRLFRTFPYQHSGRSTHRWCGVCIFQLVPSESEVCPLLLRPAPVRERTVLNTKN